MFLFLLSLFALATFSQVTFSSTYQFESGVHYGGNNIGNCGQYSTQEELEAACSSNTACVGYSMNNNFNTGATPDVDGFYPWCLKSTEDASATSQANHNYYRKPQTQAAPALPTCASDPCLNGDDTAICTDPAIPFLCGSGSGSKDWTPEKGMELITYIPVNVRNLEVTLNADKDIDINLITISGEKLAGYGGIVRNTDETATVRGMEIYFSGDDTTNPVAETIRVDHVKEPLNLYARIWFADTVTSIVYSWSDIDPCDPNAQGMSTGRVCSCDDNFAGQYDDQYGCKSQFSVTPTVSYLGDVFPGMNTIPNILGGDFCIFFEFVSSTPCKIQDDDNAQWYDGCGMLDGDVPTPKNDFGITLGRQGEVFFGVGNPDVSIMAGSGTAPGYADGSRHRVCAARSQSSGKIVLYVDEVFIGAEYGNMEYLTDSGVLHLGNTRLHPGYEYEGTLSNLNLWDSMPCGCLPDQSVMGDHSGLINQSPSYPDVDPCLGDWTQVGDLSTGNYIDGDVYILGKFNKPDTLGCSIECTNTPACAAFSFSGQSIFSAETTGECILYKKTEPNKNHGANTRFCMKTGILPKCDDGNGKVCGNRERECWEMCGEAEGYCNACSQPNGLQGACCRSDYNSGANSICATRVNSNWYLGPGYHQCVILD